jgi:NADP-dependent 3-hydroxy acid dehydrogenase YdfG
MNATNVGGYMYAAHAVLNRAMLPKSKGTGGEGTILNVTSVTGLEAPPFPGEAVYHANKALQEAFTNSLRIELAGTNVRVLALRPGVVETEFHRLRVGHDKGLYEEFVDGYRWVFSGGEMERKKRGGGADAGAHRTDLFRPTTWPKPLFSC